MQSGGGPTCQDHLSTHSLLSPPSVVALPCTNMHRPPPLPHPYHTPTTALLHLPIDLSTPFFSTEHPMVIGKYVELWLSPSNSHHRTPLPSPNLPNPLSMSTRKHWCNEHSRWAGPRWACEAKWVPQPLNSLVPTCHPRRRTTWRGNHRCHVHAVIHNGANKFQWHTSGWINFQWYRGNWPKYSRHTIEMKLV
jgi:hypothetical protein